MTAGISIYLWGEILFLRKINWYIFWFSVGGQFAGRREMGRGCPLPRRFSGSCMTWLSFVSFFFFCSKCICCVVWLDILLLCGDISSLDQYKQRKHGVWEGTRRVMNTEIQGEAAEIWGQAFGLPQSVVNYQGWVSCAQKFGERKHPAGLCHARNLSLGSKFIIGIAFAFLIAMCLTLNFWSLRRPHQRHPSPTDILPATLDKWARPGPPMKFPLFFFSRKLWLW